MKLFRPARSPNPDVTLMIFPLPRSSICGITAREQYIAPVRFVAMPTRHCSSVIASSELPNPSVAPPALFTRISIRPNSPSDASTIALTDSESVTSHCITRQRRPLSRTSPAVSSICDSVRAVATIFTPASASATAIALPNPRPAPVTIATFPSRRSLSRTPICTCPVFLLPASFFPELPVPPFQRRLQPLLLRSTVELVHDRCLAANGVALGRHPLHRTCAHQLHRHVHDALVRRQQIDVDQRHLASQRLHLRFELLGRYRFQHKSRALRLLARDHVAGEQHALRPLRPAQVRPHVADRRAHRPHRWKANPRVFSRQHDIAEEGEVRPAREAVTAHLADHRPVHVPDGHPHLLRLLEVPDVALHRVRRRRVRQLPRRRRDVIPGRERPPGPAQDHHVYLRVAVRRPESVPQLLLHLPRDRVQLIRPVQRNPRLPAVRLVEDGRIVHHLLLTSPSCHPAERRVCLGTCSVTRARFGTRNIFCVRFFGC